MGNNNKWGFGIIVSIIIISLSVLLAQNMIVGYAFLTS